MYGGGKRNFCLTLTIIITMECECVVVPIITICYRLGSSNIILQALLDISGLLMEKLEAFSISQHPYKD